MLLFYKVYLFKLFLLCFKKLFFRVGGNIIFYVRESCVVKLVVFKFCFFNCFSFFSCKIKIISVYIVYFVRFKYNNKYK